MNSILDRVEDSLKDFRPRTQREFVALQIAQRFNDTGHLARYLLISARHPKRELLEAARLAALQVTKGSSPVERFFELLETFRKEVS